MYETVLVPTDGSDATAAAVEHAVAIATAHGASIHGLSVVDRRRVLAAPEDEKEAVRADLEDRAREAVAAVAEAAEDAGLEAETTVAEGVPFREIVAAADAGADLVVMGTHGRTGPAKRAALGSVTERVVTGARTPVLVVEVGDRDEDEE